jgi:hypothetical protein
VVGWPDLSSIRGLAARSVATACASRNGDVGRGRRSAPLANLTPILWHATASSNAEDPKSLHTQLILARRFVVGLFEGLKPTRHRLQVAVVSLGAGHARTWMMPGAVALAHDRRSGEQAAGEWTRRVGARARGHRTRTSDRRRARPRCGVFGRRRSRDDAAVHRTVLQYGGPPDGPRVKIPPPTPSSSAVSAVRLEPRRHPRRQPRPPHLHELTVTEHPTASMCACPRINQIALAETNAVEVAQLIADHVGLVPDTAAVSRRCPIMRPETDREHPETPGFRCSRTSRNPVSTATRVCDPAPIRSHVPVDDRGSTGQRLWPHA